MNSPCVCGCQVLYTLMEPLFIDPLQLQAMFVYSLVQRPYFPHSHSELGFTSHLYLEILYYLSLYYLLVFAGKPQLSYGFKKSYDSIEFLAFYYYQSGATFSLALYILGIRQKSSCFLYMIASPACVIYQKKIIQFLWKQIIQSLT